MRLFRIFSISWLALLLLASFLVHIGIFQVVENVDANKIFETPSMGHWLGTDSLGRDLLLRILLGSGTSLFVACFSILISTIIAFLYGASSGWLGHRFDRLMMIALDVWMSLPSGVLATIVALLFISSGDSVILVGIVIGLTHWGRLARLVRSEVLDLKRRQFVTAALSKSPKYICFHMFPR
jgi:ABC-type dipeptide/oligopeptide/nickel transport system permease subunit